MNTTSRIIALATALAAAVTASACSAPADTDASPVPFELTSPDLDAQGYLPPWAINGVAGFCEGTENRSPQLDWVGAPDGTVEFALTMTDPANPTYIHWVVTDIPADTAGVAAADDGAIDIGTVGASWMGFGTYAGACLEDNEYVYTLYALDTDIEGADSTTHAILLDLIEGHVLAEASLGVKVHDATYQP